MSGDVAHGQKRLGALVGERAEARAEAGGEDEGAGHAALAHHAPGDEAAIVDGADGLGVELPCGPIQAITPASGRPRTSSRQRTSSASPSLLPRCAGSVPAGPNQPRPWLLPSAAAKATGAPSLPGGVNGAARAVGARARPRRPRPARSVARDPIEERARSSRRAVDAADARSRARRSDATAASSGARMFSTTPTLAEAARGEEGARVVIAAVEPGRQVVAGMIA